MKGSIRSLLLLTLLAINLNVVGFGPVRAQTFTSLYSFTGNSDGAQPHSSLVLLGNTLYGTTITGGSANSGTVFSHEH